LWEDKPYLEERFDELGYGKVRKKPRGEVLLRTALGVLEQMFG
jgi:hypothetical protein